MLRTYRGGATTIERAPASPAFDDVTLCLCVVVYGFGELIETQPSHQREPGLEYGQNR